MKIEEEKGQGIQVISGIRGTTKDSEMFLENLEENQPCVELKVPRGREVDFPEEGKCLLLLTVAFGDK